MEVFGLELFEDKLLVASLLDDLVFRSVFTVVGAAVEYIQSVDAIFFLTCLIMFEIYAYEVFLFYFLFCC
jgi:hypothetical protein